MADLIVGGGRYGERAAQYLIEQRRQFVVVDPDPECTAVAGIRKQQGTYPVIPGGLDAALRAFMDYRPGLVFPTAPAHVAAGLVCEAGGFRESPGGIPGILERIPPGLVLGTRGGSVFLSVNRDSTCIPDCPSPDTCPVTGEDRSEPLHQRLRQALPRAFILESIQVAPGLGALRGNDVADLIRQVGGRKQVIIGTACRCHGVVTMLVSRQETESTTGMNRAYRIDSV
ncbi:MAG TPA: hypothetical protein PLN56_04110 [Methanoregulaceae archaeon]|nr:MAG: hypothetical protein IPI71_08195 [Methanolinea sp.]HON81229.1 hypothetical protein [Methanoregulaceae archaeon]HPD10166.1 hypothetical protein [Methanoregulaceae archaeon]HRT15171.1 hypothetical protein [Methanoregulaceae archaeon]HRU30712.1 hypothetical protein [Methanoregulaceae archaeon]